MPTALTLLFPDGYAVREDIVVGTIDTLAVLDEESGSATAFDGTLSSGGTLLVRGWAVDVVRGLPGAGVVVTLGDAVVEAVYGEMRPDIAEKYGKRLLARTGFSAAIAPAPGAAGPLRVRAHVVSSDAREISELAGARGVEVVPGEVEIAFTSPRRPGFATVQVDAWRAAHGDTAEAFAEQPLVVERGTVVVLRGWAFDTAARRPLRGAFLIIDDHDVVRASIGLRRGDVAAVYGEEALATAGFEVRFDTAGLPAGVHRLRLGMVSRDGDAHDRVDLAQRLEILPALRP